MKIFRILLIAMFLTGLQNVAIANADSTVKLNGLSNGYVKDKLKRAEILSNKLVDLKSATIDFYIEKNRFPDDKDELVTDGFYFSNFNTVYGNKILYSEVSNIVTFSVDVNDKNTASIVASMISATSNGKIVEMKFGKPSQSSIISTALSKVWDGNVARNTMETDLYLDGNDLLDANDIHANTLNGAGGVYDEGVRVFSVKNLPNKNHVGLSNVENYSISNSYSSSRSNFYASEKAVGDSHGVLLAKIEALTKGDIGLGNVPNYAATNQFDGNSANLLVTQRALRGAYNELTKNKLGVKDTAVNSNLLNGYSSNDFVKVTTKINGKPLKSSINLTKNDVGLGNVPNYKATNSYEGKSEQLFTTQSALNKAYNALNDKIDNLEVGDADTLNGYSSDDFVKVTTKINGKPLNSNINLTKNDVGLGNVPNYAASNSYTGNRSDLLSTQKALYDAYQSLDSTKLDITGTAANSHLLNNIHSSSFVQTSRRINGENLGSDINLNKNHIGLGNVGNYGISDSINGSSSTVYASQKAVGDLYRSTLKPMVIKKFEGSNIGGEGWGADIYECNPNSLTMKVSGHRRIKSGKQFYSATSFGIKLKKSFKNTTSPTVLSVTADLLFGVSRGDEVAAKLLEESIFPSLYTSHGDHDEGGLKFSWSWLYFKYYNVDKSNDSKGYSFSATGEVDDCVFN